MSEGGAKKNHNKYRRDKPWDTDDIEHWKIPEWKEEFLKGSLLEESSFATLFPKYREKYLREVWPLVTRELEKYKIDCELNLIEGSMTVRTTRKTRDPYIIVKARDLIKLLARSIPLDQAVKIMEDDINCDIIKTGGFVRNKERFVKRRQRLVGPDGATLKAIELLTGCYVLVQGNTVAAMGNFKGLKQVRQVVEDCFKNVHPIYNIKRMMIKRELAKDPSLANENWDRFLPQFKKKNVQRKKPKVVGKKKEYTPFPPAPVPSKVDLQLESGEYFLNEKQRQQKKRVEKRMQAAETAQDRRNERMKDYVAPKEPSVKKKKKKNSSGGDSSSGSFALESSASKQSASKKQQIEGLKQSFLAKQTIKNKAEISKKSGLDDYVISAKPKAGKRKRDDRDEKASKKAKNAKPTEKYSF